MAKLLTVKESASQLRLAEITIRTWMAQRRIAYVKLGRSVRVPESEIQRIVDGGTVPNMRESRINKRVL